MRYRVKVLIMKNNGEASHEEWVMSCSDGPPEELDVLNVMISEKREGEPFLAGDMPRGIDRETRISAQLGLKSLEIIEVEQLS